MERTEGERNHGDPCFLCNLCASVFQNSFALNLSLANRSVVLTTLVEIGEKMEASP
ncbi:MAG: hypothetical protein JWP89_3192 [Schlesneria sp.]|nr:hypothetical protein [Schlesneria sp.]